jgi:hypothetical protein
MDAALRPTISSALDHSREVIAEGLSFLRLEQPRDEEIAVGFIEFHLFGRGRHIV